MEEAEKDLREGERKRWVEGGSSHALDVSSDGKGMAHATMQAQLSCRPPMSDARPSIQATAILSTAPV